MGPCYRPPPTLTMGDSTAMPPASPAYLFILRSSAALVPLNGVGNGGGARTSGDSRSLYIRRRASEARTFGYPARRGRYPLPTHPRDSAQYSDHRIGYG